MILLVVGVFLLLFLWEAPGLVAKEYWRELAVFTILLLIGLVFSLLLVGGVELPYIESFWIKVFAKVGKALTPGS
ncbi:MAG: hypothetical protein GX081_02285 [Firmicutes bacterium]|nr:hypothetical protein [Bacillota bacterium]